MPVMLIGSDCRAQRVHENIGRAKVTDNSRKRRKVLDIAGHLLLVGLPQFACDTIECNSDSFVGSDKANRQKDRKANDADDKTDINQKSDSLHSQSMLFL
jgi:hypothetical protein